MPQQQPAIAAEHSATAFSHAQFPTQGWAPALVSLQAGE